MADREDILQSYAKKIYILLRQDLDIMPQDRNYAIMKAIQTQDEELFHLLVGDGRFYVDDDLLHDSLNYQGMVHMYETSPWLMENIVRMNTIPKGNPDWSFVRRPT